MAQGLSSYYVLFIILNDRKYLYVDIYIYIYVSVWTRVDRYIYIYIYIYVCGVGPLEYITYDLVPTVDETLLPR